MNHLDPGRQHLVDSVLDDGMRLPAADLHDLPGVRGDSVNLPRCPLRDLAIAEFGEVLHWLVQLPSGQDDCGESAALASASSSLASSSSSMPIARKSSSVCSAVSSSILESAKPTWTMV